MAKSPRRTIPCNHVNVDFDVYPRVHREVSEFHVRKLMEAFDAGTIFPPIVLEQGTNRLVDGFHRLETHMRKEVPDIACEFRVYANDGALMAEAVRLNTEHGLALTLYDIKDSIRRLNEMGYALDGIGEAVRMPVTKVTDIIKGGYATSGTTGKPVTLKGGLGHMRGQVLTPLQEAMVPRYGGAQATNYVKWLLMLLDSGSWPGENVTLRNEMDKLCDHWQQYRS